MLSVHDEQASEWASGSGRIRPSTSHAGDPAWHVSGYALVSRLLMDARLGRTHPDPDRAPRYSDSVIFGRAQPSTATEAADDARLRASLGPWFSPRRMALIRPRVQEIVRALLDDLDSKGPPADFHEAVSFPLPALVICELLGVPYEDREDFRRWSDDAAAINDEVRSSTGLAALWQYMLDLVRDKCASPGEDVLSHLLTSKDGVGGALTPEYVAMLGAALLFAGHETTVAAIDKGAVLIATEPGLRELLGREPALIEPAVEEILRLPLPVGAQDDGPAVGLPRWAKTDLEIDGTLVRAGELVLLDLQGANLDPQVFPSPERLDVRRPSHTHLSFGRGPHFCIGAPLARMELQVVFSSLLRRFPALALAASPDELRPRTDLLTGGLHTLPVRW